MVILQDLSDVQVESKHSALLLLPLVLSSAAAAAAAAQETLREKDFFQGAQSSAAVLSLQW